MPTAVERQARNESVKNGAISQNGNLVTSIDQVLFTLNTARRRAYVAEDGSDQMSSKVSVNRFIEESSKQAVRVSWGTKVS